MLAAEEAVAKENAQPSAKGRRSAFWLAAFGSVLLWLAFPPLDLGPLAFIAIVPWLILVRRQELPGRRPYRALFLAGALFWGAAVYWITLPHWSAAIGWIFLTAYLALYLPAYVALCRVAVHRMGVSILWAAPIVWTALELLRAYVLTGFLMVALGHTQYRWIELIQISDLVGAYGVSFVVAFVAACLARMAPLDGRRTVFWPVAPAVLIFAVVLGYGYWRVAPPEGTGEKGPRIALVQGSIDTDFEGNYRETCDATYRQYRRLSLDAVYKNPDLDLVVWPESMFGWPVVEFERGAARPPDFPGSQADWQAKLRAESDGSRQLLIDTTEALAAPLLVGISLHRAEPDGVKRYNTALLIDYDRQTEQARRMGRYDKMHLAPFGEYIPMSDVFPRLYDFTPLPGPMEAGKRAEAFPVGPKKQWLFAPSICYESILPHVMLRQLAQLRADGKEPDVMISITNDGWFWGSSALDMHMICSVFRAVELRKPFLSAANTGISAWVDADGRIIQRGPRRDTTVLTTEVSIDHRDSFYARTGDLFAYFCAGCTLLFAVVGFWQSRKFRKVSTAPVGGN